MDEPLSFDELRPLLKVRLYHDEFPEGAELVSRPVAPGVVAVLTLDLPTTIETVSPHQLEAWGQTADALLDRGIASALADDDLEQSSLDDGEGTTIQMLSGESFYVATQLLGLDEWLPPGLPGGALVAIPQRHRLLFYPIEDTGVVKAVTTMLRSTRELYRRGPGSLSPDLFWWRDGRLTLLPSHQDEDGSLVFSPPGAFLDVVDRLANAS